MSDHDDTRPVPPRLAQLRLVTAITFEISRQYPNAVVNPEVFNAVIAAANSIVAVWNAQLPGDVLNLTLVPPEDD